VIDRLRLNLVHFKTRVLTDINLVPSAVILPLFLKNSEYHILFIRRTMTVKDHKGQISFPGGRFEVRDKNLLETALRECEEEIGIPRSAVEVIGELDEHATRTTSYRIATFVGVIPYPFEFKLDKREIENTIEIPVSVLARIKRTFGKSGRDFPEYNYVGAYIWGATAIILTQFLDIWDELSHLSER
jgi:8-oxo-dGTP pyrophosphatase MutT (NUDIX family)